MLPVTHSQSDRFAILGGQQPLADIPKIVCVNNLSSVNSIGGPSEPAQVRLEMTPVLTFYFCWIRVNHIVLPPTA